MSFKDWWKKKSMFGFHQSPNSPNLDLNPSIPPSSGHTLTLGKKHLFINEKSTFITKFAVFQSIISGACWCSFNWCFGLFILIFICWWWMQELKFCLMRCFFLACGFEYEKTVSQNWLSQGSLKQFVPLLWIQLSLGIY